MWNEAILRTVDVYTLYPNKSRKSYFAKCKHDSRMICFCLLVSFLVLCRVIYRSLSALSSKVWKIDMGKHTVGRVFILRNVYAYQIKCRFIMRISQVSPTSERAHAQAPTINENECPTNISSWPHLVFHICGGVCVCSLYVFSIQQYMRCSIVICVVKREFCGLNQFHILSTAANFLTISEKAVKIG